MEGNLDIIKHGFSDAIDMIQVFWNAIRTQIHNQLGSRLVIGLGTPVSVLHLVLIYKLYYAP